MAHFYAIWGANFFETFCDTFILPKTSAEEVKREIDLAIAAARKNPDPNIQAFWNSIPCKGQFPTSEEVIAYIAEIGRGITK